MFDIGPPVGYRPTGHDNMRSVADLRGASTLVSFNHVIYPHFAAFSNNLYTATICNPKPNPNPNLNSDPDPDRSGSGSGSNLTLAQTQTLTLTLP